jgi:hypothetical protein
MLTCCVLTYSAPPQLLNKTLYKTGLNVTCNGISIAHCPRGWPRSHDIWNKIWNLYQRLRFVILLPQPHDIVRCTTYGCSKGVCVCVRARARARMSVWFEDFTAMKIQVAIFWVVASCSDVLGNQRFGAKFCLHLQGKVTVEESESIYYWQSVSQLVCIGFEPILGTHGHTLTIKMLWVMCRGTSSLTGGRACRLKS